MGEAIASVFQELVIAVYEPARDQEFERLVTHAAERFDTAASLLRSQLDLVLSRISISGGSALDEFESRRLSARDQLTAKLRTHLEAAGNEEKKSRRGRLETAKYSAGTVILSALLSVITSVGIQQCYKSKQDRQGKINEQRFEVRLEVQRALTPPLEAVASYLQIISASKPNELSRSQARLQNSLQTLDAQIPLQTGRVAFAYDSATVDSVFTVLSEFQSYYRHLDSLRTNGDSVERILPRAAELSVRASSLVLRLNSYENGA